MLNVALIGLGGVGQEVLRQLQLPALKGRFKLVALYTTSRSWRLVNDEDPDAVQLATAMRCKVGSNSMNVQAFDGEVSTMMLSLQGMPLPLLVIDCTSNEDLASRYPEILAYPKTHIVTPNKKAFSGNIALMDAIEKSKRSTGNMIMNEATVGAGLPIICSLKDMLATGDRIKRIEGVFSGTLSYIFNFFSTADGASPKFSDVVKKAREAGYTEPNPADDLDGSDVARKLCILARVIFANQGKFDGLPDGFRSVETENLVPKQLCDVKSGKLFIEELAQFDPHFDRMREEATKANSVLRYVGVIDLEHQQPIIQTGLKRYPQGHPFCSALRGSDNIICFHSDRYIQQPLVIQGPGAGAAVTAMGVLADAVRVADRLF